jgi:hypothetical protein
LSPAGSRSLAQRLHVRARAARRRPASDRASSPASSVWRDRSRSCRRGTPSGLRRAARPSVRSPAGWLGSESGPCPLPVRAVAALTLGPEKALASCEIAGARRQRAALGGALSGIRQPLDAAAAGAALPMRRTRATATPR